MRFKDLLFLLCAIIAFGFSTREKGNTIYSKYPDTQSTVSHEEAEKWATETLSTLSIGQKVSQMICEQIRGEYIAEDNPKFQYWVRLIRDYGIGGFVLYGGTPHDTAHLLNRLQREAQIPLLISADFESGPGQQIQGATEFPANMALSAIGSEELAYQVGKIGALEGRAIGIHLTYSPVVDIQTKPENPVLSVRSFGSNLNLLGRMAGAYIKGYQENGMLATAKHYPGRGDVELIPGTKFTVNKKSASKVEAEDFFAFKKAIEAGVTFIMSEHIAVPSVTEGSDLPASVEKKIATYWLREKLGFNGVLTTDDMWYEKVTKRFGAVKACIMAIQAGHDVILKPENVADTIEGLVKAVKMGEISERRIEQSVKRILYWKARLNLHRNRFVDIGQISSVVGIKNHQDLVHKIAESSLTLLKNDGFFPSDASKIGKILHISIQKKENDQAPFIVSSKLKEEFLLIGDFHLEPNIDFKVYEEALQTVKKADTVVISIFNQRTVYKDNGPLKEKYLKFISEVIKIKPHSTIVMSYGNPYLAESLKKATAFVTGYGEGGFYGNQIVYADAFIKLLKGELSPRGKLPIKVSETFPLGTGRTY